MVRNRGRQNINVKANKPNKIRIFFNFFIFIFNLLSILFILPLQHLVNNHNLPTILTEFAKESNDRPICFSFGKDLVHLNVMN